MAVGCFISTGRSSRRPLERVQPRGVARLRGGLSHPARGPRRPDGGDRLRAAPPSASSVGHRRGADLHAHAGDDGADGRHHRRPLGRRASAGAGRLPPAGRRGLARPEHRQAGRRDARVRRHRAGDPAGRGPAAEGEKWLLGFRLWAWSRAPSCPSTSPRCRPGCCAWRARSPTAWCSGSAPRAYIRDVVVPTSRGPRARRQGAGGVRHRRRGPGGAHRATRRRVGRCGATWSPTSRCPSTAR